MNGIYYRYINEVYFGGNKNLQEMEKCIGEIRRDCQMFNIGQKLNTHPSVQKFNRLAEKEFGFKAFSLYIMPTTTINAFTMPVSFDFKQPLNKNASMDNLIVSKNGYKYKKEAKYMCLVVVYKGLFLKEDFTDREVLAVILHEIGHNFQHSISSTNALLATAMGLIQLIAGTILFLTTANFIPLAMVSGELTSKGVSIINYIEKEIPWAMNVLDMTLSIKDTILYPIKKIKGYIGNILVLPYLPIYLIKQLNPIELALNKLSGRYRGEKIADNFTTIYGYGKDQASALSKMEGDEVLNNVNIPLITPMIGMLDAVIHFVILMVDEHPATIVRVRDQANYLRKELKKADIDPKMVKEINKQIDEIEDTAQQLINYKETNPQSFRYLHKVLANFTDKHGEPLKDLLKYGYDDINTDLQNVYDKKIAESTSIIDDIKFI